MSIRELFCNNCGHKWHPLKVKPKVCPRCKSYKWNITKEKGETKHIMVSEEPESYSIGDLIKERLREG